MKHTLGILLLIGLPAFSQTEENFFYKNRRFGSEALFNPLSELLNSSFDIIQLDGHSRNVFELPYGKGFTNIARNMRDPFGPISRYGWGKFLTDQVFPIHLTRKDAQWWPNYQLHLIGGGMTYRRLIEWYRTYDVPSPTAFAIGTMTAVVVLNESVENGAYQGDNVDPIADLYIFDPGGMILFSFDGVAQFFAETMNLADWSLQPSFTTSPFALHNNGQYFSMKWRLPFSDHWHLFYYFGMNGLIGLSYKLDDGSAFSLGGGLRGKKLHVVDQSTNKQTLELIWNVGAFYDKENSLMASLFVSGLTDYTASLNLYPGMIDIGGFTPGLWLVFARNGRFLVGISTVWTPGLGFKTQ